MAEGIDRDRLRTLLTERGRTARDVSRKAKLGETAVKDILSGKSKRPEFDTLAAIARELGCSVSDFVNEAELSKPLPASPRSMAPDPLEGLLPIRGDIQAGAFLKVNLLDQREAVYHPAPHDRRYPKVRQWLSRVTGDSMNALTKGGMSAGLLEGDLVHMVDAYAIDYRPATGDIVEVVRERFDGREREVTLKQIEVTNTGEVLLWPRSTNTAFGGPIAYTEGLDEEGATVEIRGKMLQVVRTY
jgi:transcriptional regulator with XRE-family HTH domain